MLFNGVDFSDYVVVEHIKRQILPSINSTVREIPGKDGDALVSQNLGSTIIEVDVRLIEDTRVDMQKRAREVAALLYTSKPARLELRDEPDKYNMASVEGDSEIETYLGIGLATINFMCYDPLAYSREEKSVSIPSNITNEGTKETRGVATITVSKDTDALEVRNQTTGEFVKIEVDLSKNEVVTFDFINENVSKDGVSIMKYLTWQSDFFDLNPGTNDVRVIGGSGEMIFRERWI